MDATITLHGSNGWQKQLQIGPFNADVLQMVELPSVEEQTTAVGLEMSGRGQALMQTVRRYNLAQATPPDTSVFKLDVIYSANQIEVNNQLMVRVNVEYTPPNNHAAGMSVLDVALPTGFGPVEESLVALAKSQAGIKCYDLAGRKVIIYLEEGLPILNREGFLWLSLGNFRPFHYTLYLPLYLHNCTSLLLLSLACH